MPRHRRAALPDVADVSHESSSARSWPPISSSCQPPRIDSSSCWSSWPISDAASCTSRSRPIPQRRGLPNNSARRFLGTQVPRYLIRDRDSAFAGIGPTATGMGIHEVLTAPRSPWQNAYAERLIGSIRRECLDHVIVVNETGLSRVLSRYLAYYHESRTHLSLAKDSPQPRPIAPPTIGPVVAIPQVGGLHHRYDRGRRSHTPLSLSAGGFGTVGVRLTPHDRAFRSGSHAPDPTREVLRALCRADLAHRDRR